MVPNLCPASVRSTDETFGDQPSPRFEKGFPDFNLVVSSRNVWIGKSCVFMIMLNSLNVAAAFLMGGGLIFVSTGSHSTLAGLRVPKLRIHQGECRLDSHTGVQYSAAEYTRLRVDVLWTSAAASNVVPGSLLIIFTLDLTLTTTFLRCGLYASACLDILGYGWYYRG